MENNEKINLKEKFSLFKDYWSPKIVGNLNDNFIKLAKFKGEFTWHKHDQEDELFMVVHGDLTIKLRDRDVQIGPGEMFIVPKGVEHMPVAEDEAHVLLVEPKSVLNTGDNVDEKTVRDLERI